MGVRPVDRGALAAILLVTGVVAVSVLWSPPDDGGFVVCVFNRLTGLPCPGCGLTRAFCAIGKGDLARAVAFNPLAPVVFLAFLGAWVRSAALLLGKSEPVARFDAFARRARLPLVGLALLVSVWVVRLVLLASDGRLTALASKGLLFKFFFFAA